MAIRKYKPTTPGRRGSSVADFVEITRTTPEKSLVAPAAQEGRPQQPGPDHHPAPGRRPQARLPHHRLPSLRQGRRAGEGRAHRVRPEPHRPDRAAALRRRREALHHRADRTCARARAVESGADADIKAGNNLPLRNIPVGTTIHCIELRPGGGAKIARSAGNSRPAGRQGGLAAPQLRMPSGEMRYVDVRCRATVGEVGNAEQSNINWGKAGRMRWKGKRPTVRGVVMNPVDHPHGGGEGKTSGGRHPVSPVGQARGPHAQAQGQRRPDRPSPQVRQEALRRD